MVLKKLEEQVLITSEIEQQDSRPNRRVYTITESGRTELQNWLATPITTLEPHKVQLLLKIFFSASVGKESVLTQLRLQRQLHQQQLTYYQTTTKAVIQDAARRQDNYEQDALFWEAVRRFGELYEETYVRWLDETITLVHETLPE